MNQARQKIPFTVLLVLLCLGAGAATFAFWLVDHRQAIPASGIIIAISLGIFFATYTGALLLYLRQRDTRRAMGTKSASAILPSQQNLEGTVYGMVSGDRYRVIKPFTDYYGNSFEQNEFLRFKERHFLPYEGGHTIVFDKRILYLQEEKNKEILENFSEYIVKTIQ